MIRRIISGGKPNSYSDKDTGRTYRRILGGVSWPLAAPGGVVVLAEDKDIETPEGLKTDFKPNERRLWVLYAYENQSLSEILARCREMQELMSIQKFYGDTTNRAMMRLKNQFQSGLGISKAPFVDESNSTEVYLTLIREKCSIANKVLNFGENSTLSAKLNALEGIPQSEVAKAASPSIVALGYALAAITRSMEKPVVMPHVSYQPLDPGVGY